MKKFPSVRGKNSKSKSMTDMICKSNKVSFAFSGLRREGSLIPMIVNRLKPVEMKECTDILGSTIKDGERNLMVKGWTRGVIEKVCHIFQSQQPCVRGAASMVKETIGMAL